MGDVANVLRLQVFALKDRWRHDSWCSDTNSDDAVNEAVARIGPTQSGPLG